MSLERNDDRVWPDELRAKAALLRTFVHFTLPLTIVWGITLALVAPHAAVRTLGFAGVFCSFGVAALWCIRSGKVLLAIRAMGFVFWCAVAWSSYTGGGVAGPSYQAFAAIILMSGVLWSSRATVVMIGATAVWGAALVWLETHGHLPASRGVDTPTGRWLASCLVFGTVATLQHMSSRALRQNLARARDENEQRTRAERVGLATLHQLEQSERRYRHIFDSAAVALFEIELSALAVWCREQRAGSDAASLRERLAREPELVELAGERIYVVDFNDAAARVLDLDDKDAMRGPLGRRFRPEQRWAVIEIALALLESPESVQREITIWSFQGREKRVLLTGRLPEAAGPLAHLRVVMSIVDVTEQRKLEERIHATQRMEAIGRLAGGVAHDFNNALVVILSWANMLREPGASEAERKEGLDAISQSANRAAELTRQLLSIGRRRVSEPKATRADALIDETVRAIARLLPADIEVHVGQRCDVPVMVDEAQLHQVLLNLALNARDAMPRGGRIELSSSLATQAELAELGELAPGRYVSIRVTDSGMGMDANTCARVFEPFFTTKSESGGTGLGLATAQAIVIESRGRITVASKPGAGTTFHVLLPAAVSLTTSAANMQPQAGGGRSVLLVEDDALVRSVMSQTLSAAGYSVHTAQDGASALELARERHGKGRPIDVLCTDAVMPGLPTRDLIDELAKLFPDTPVLVCSGHIAEDLFRRRIEGGEWAFLAKPFTPEQLLRKLSELLPRYPKAVASAS